MERKRNIRIAHTQITPTIRVSTAAIYYDEVWGERFQYETFCFSEDPRQKTFQAIHGSYWKCDFYYLRKSVKVHRYIANNLKERFKKEAV